MAAGRDLSVRMKQLTIVDGSRKRKKEMYGSLAVNRKIEEHSLARIKCKKSMKESIVEEFHCCKH